MNEFTQEVGDALQRLGLNIDAAAIIKIENYEPKGYKTNFQEIIRDAIVINLHEQGIIRDPNINITSA